MHYGKAVEQLFNLNIDTASQNNYMFKIEAANMEKYDSSGLNDDLKKVINNMIIANGEVANILGGGTSAKVLSTLKTDKGEEPLFNEAIIVPVQMDEGGVVGKMNAAGVSRGFFNHIYNIYKGNVDANSSGANRSEVQRLFSSDEASTVKGLRNVILGKASGDNVITPLLASYIFDLDSKGALDIKIEQNKIPNAHYSGTDIFKKLDSLSINGEDAFNINFDESGGSLDYFGNRLIKVYPISSILKTVGNVLGVREGTEFGLYSTFIYMTYLDWYGVKKNGLTGVISSEFNTRIFSESDNILKVDVSTLIDTTSAEDKQRDIIDYTYLMLHPTKGREYRAEVLTSAFSDWVYNTYQKIVYGNADQYNSSNYSNLSTRNATGFLNLSTYSENFMTSWFIKVYPKIAIAIIALAFVLIIIIGLIKGRKLSWFLIALAVVINTILIVPSSGEIVPLVVNNMVQGMFSDKMTYWAISEAVENQTLESQYLNNTSLSQEENQRIVDLVKSLNVVYLDKSLMIKKDISSKVTHVEISNYAEIQNLRTARWMLPIIMSQFTADDGSANYVYVPLGQMYDDLSNMYWFYNPSDASSVQTTYASQNAVTGAFIPKDTRQVYYPNYVDTTQDDSTTVDYRSQAYTEKASNLNDMPHTYFYLLTDIDTLLSRNNGFGGSYTGDKSFENYITNSISSGSKSDFEQAANKIELDAGTYVDSDRNTMKSMFGYLWATESPYHYMYESIKDNFSSSISLGQLVGDIQGQYVKLDDGSEVRTNFMYSDRTGYIKDVLDLEEMFTNMIPYLYQMQITAGGLDGTSGVLGDAKIEDYDIYTGNYKSWLFRSNWVTKLMESNDYTNKTTVTDKDGNEYTIANPMLADCYPMARPMIFSEAQMYAQGLTEADLNIVELKCVKINKDVSKRWTMLLNYAGAQGISKEVYYRQMTNEAVMAFNAEFSPKGVFNNAYKLYPDGIDLRAISFDSVMRMLMLNVTKDTSYINSNTMKNVIEDSDIFTATLLLISAFFCAYLIPFVRNVTMGLIFFLGFIAIIYALLSSTKQKYKISCGYLVSNLIFMVMTIAYYLTFSGLMAATTSDSVLTAQSVQVSSGNPVWCFIIIIVVSVAYTLGMFKMISFCFKHYRDMGFEVYATIASSITDSISNGMEHIGSKMTGEYPDGSGNKNKQAKRPVTNDNHSLSEEGSTIYYGDADDYMDTSEPYDKYESRSYTYETHKGTEFDDSTEVDVEIEKGRHMEESKHK